MATKQKNPSLVSPKGLLKFPRITGEPDYKFDKERGDYGTKLLLEPDAKGVPEFLAVLDKATDEAFEQMKTENPKHAKKMVRGAPYKMEEDKEGEETGLVEISVGMKHKVTSKKPGTAGNVYLFTPKLFDSLGKPITDKTLKVGGGTLAKVSFEYYPYVFLGDTKKAGISKRLQAVQILDLKEYQDGGTAESFGFGDEDEGFVADNAKAAAPGVDDEEETPSGPTTGSDF